ncbi:orotidine-5'-phosphate decarboxylase [Armatimonas rosea]|uniref:Orotidine 5'-phosphate decarboxylase n=1 Tax=Armatimonas rosea TaxID=685828 RepID=A0A7W9SSY9_ARMRO|nr:orotidine-5'-phosphate decarboxylase [Armatimonas rosea]MBB6051389.1 orotidine-5'-phosphate decarboxylase [Armatimonas rosea]
MINEPKDRVLVALDFDTADDALALAQQLAGKVGGVKVGLELVNAAGFDIFARLQDAGIDRIFYDAKFHDIPNTVAGAIRAATKRGVWMVNVHTSGGKAMMEAARDAAHATSETPPLLIGVTVLTSIDQLTLASDLRVTGPVSKHVSHLAALAQEAGLDGVVSSPLELDAIRATCGPDFVTVIPGIRPAGVGAQDQKRIATPATAVAAGAHYLVVGRAITAAADPVAATDAIVAEIAAI